MRRLVSAPLAKNYNRNSEVLDLTMSSKFIVSLCSANDMASNVLENFLNSCTKFDCVDVLGGSRYSNNFSKNYVRTLPDINILRSQFSLGQNLHIASCFIEDATDLPKNIAYQQNLAEIGNVVCVCNGNINNKDTIANTYAFSIGMSNQEFLVNYYNAMIKKNLKENTIPNMVRDLDSDMLSFAIYDKNLNEIYIYNRSDVLYMRNTPGLNVIISSEVLPIGNTYPRYDFHRLAANCAIKIDTKTMFVQYLPINSNTFSYGRSVMLDHNRALLYTENCDLEYFVAQTLLSSKDVFSEPMDAQTVYFGFNTDIDKMIIDRINKVRKSSKASNKLPMHIPYTFENIYKSESEAINDIIKRQNEAIERKKEEEDLIQEANSKESNSSKKKNSDTTKTVNSITLTDKNLFLTKKLNFIAISLVNLALENNCGNIFIPNTNLHNNRLISIVNHIVHTQLHTPLNVYTLLDQLNTMDLIRYAIVCREFKNLEKVLVNCDRSSLYIELDKNAAPQLMYNANSDYNQNMICAFHKCGIENPFNDRYNGKDKVNHLLANSNIMPDKIFDNQMKAQYVDNIHGIIKRHVEYQRKLFSR